MKKKPPTNLILSDPPEDEFDFTEKEVSHAEETFEEAFKKAFPDDPTKPHIKRAPDTIPNIYMEHLTNQTDEDILLEEEKPTKPGKTSIADTDLNLPKLEAENEFTSPSTSRVKAIIGKITVKD